MKTALRILLPVLVLVAGIACAGLSVLTRPEAERSTPPPKVTAVEVVTVSSRDANARVRATGTATAAQRVALTSEVGGRIVQTSPKLRPGGRFATGEVLARVDPRDYETAVQAEKSRLEQARLELALERSRQASAEREWELLGSPSQASALALREPHLAVAEQAVRAAEAAVDRAELNLQRTAIKAPFASAVVDEQVEVGAYVGPGTPVATLVGTERVWVDVSVPVEQVGAVQFGEAGSAATVTQAVGARERVTRVGRVLGLGGQLDPQTRTARVLVEVRDPFDPEPGLPLLPGAFVEVEIIGEPLEAVFEVPRQAIWDGDRVWVVVDGRLAGREVVVAWRNEDVVFVTEGLVDGDRVVTSPLALPVEGMPVALREPPAAKAELP